jgi:hypothetical protein
MRDPTTIAREAELNAPTRIESSDLFGGFARKANIKDVVMTPDAIAEYIVNYFKPSGRILDPCRGNGAFWKRMPGADWCEIAEGRDFLEWTDRVDWIVSNPPYSTLWDFLTHSFKIADNVAYLIPLHKIWHSQRMLKLVAEYGGIKEILILGTGTSCGFPLGFAVGVFYFKRGYAGDTRIGYPPNAEAHWPGAAASDDPTRTNRTGCSRSSAAKSYAKSVLA